RTRANQTPPARPLFEIHDGGISTGVVGELGEIDVDIPVGEGNVHVRIPLTHVSEGAEAPLTGSELVPHTVPGDVSEVDALLGAHVWAHADIETAFTGLSPLISQNHNIARALGMFELHSRNRPAPQAVGERAAEHAEGQSAAPEAEPPTRDRFKGDCYAG